MIFAELVAVLAVFIGTFSLAIELRWFSFGSGISSHFSFCIIPEKLAVSYPFYGEFALGLAKRCVAQIPIIGVGFLMTRLNVFGSLSSSRRHLVYLYSLFLTCTIAWFIDQICFMPYVWFLCLTRYRDPLRALALSVMLLLAVAVQCSLVGLALKAGRARAQLIHE